MTPRWLSDVLSQYAGETVEVSAFDVIEAHDGTTGRAVIELGYSVGGSDLPRRMFLKLPPADLGQREMVRIIGMGKREATVYKQLSAELPVRMPTCYFSDCDERGDRYVMLLEDLVSSRCDLRSGRDRCSVEDARKVITALARCHGKYKDSPLFENELSWIEPPIWHPMSLDMIKAAVDAHKADQPKIFTRFADFVIEHADQCVEMWGRGWQTLIHGDAHAGNSFMDGDEAGFFDWALVSRISGMRDVAYYLVSSLDPVARRTHERELLKLYRHGLTAAGADAPGLEALWEEYRLHAAYVWVASAATLGMGDALQPVELVKTVLSRVHPAVEELDTIGAFRRSI
jgi:hypothetical protein